MSEVEEKKEEAKVKKPRKPRKPRTKKSDESQPNSLDPQNFKDCFGNIDWKAFAMSNPIFTVPNSFVLESRGKPEPKTTEGLKDDEKILSLHGLRLLGRIVGVKSIRFSDPENYQHSPSHYASKCTVEFSGKYDIPLIQEEVASASIGNVSEDFQGYLEALACNRAFARCIRNALCIDTVCKDELNEKKVADEESPDSNDEISGESPPSITEIIKSFQQEKEIEDIKGLLSFFEIEKELPDEISKIKTSDLLDIVGRIKSYKSKSE